MSADVAQVAKIMERIDQIVPVAAAQKRRRLQDFVPHNMMNSFKL